jgi:hypothetical protein
MIGRADAAVPEAGESTVELFDHRQCAVGDEYSTIPVLDVGPYLAGQTGAREELADNIRYIQESIGCYAIINHTAYRAPSSTPHITNSNNSLRCP